MNESNPSMGAKATGSSNPSGDPQHSPSERSTLRSFPSLGGLEFVEAQPASKRGRYELIKLIGRGSLGPVYLGRDTRGAQPVAIKLFRNASAEVAQQFFVEARPMLSWTHEHIALAYAAEGGWEGRPVFVSEHLVGRPLASFLREGQAFSATRAVELIVPVVRALAFAHSEGVIHRNLKPENVFICDDGVVKVLDFGIARVFQNDERAPGAVARAGPRVTAGESVDELTQRAAAAATLAALAPEQWTPGAVIDHRADLWAVGIMMYHLVTGRHPLDGQRLDEVAQMDKPMPMLAARPDCLPTELAAVIDGCLLKRREHRWADAVTLLRALEPFLPARLEASLKPNQRPYVGLSAFQEQDAAFFFGRSAEIAAAISRVRGHPVIAVVGPSGSGKSSFVRAGLVPALKRSGEPWEALSLRPGRNPLGALASIVAPLFTSPAPGVDTPNESVKLARRLAVEPGFAGVVLRARARKDGANLLCVVDQFEELFTLVTDAAERRAFLAALLGLADDPSAPVRLVVTIRGDFLDRCAEEPGLMARLSSGLFFLGTPGPLALREAITAPAELAGYHFEAKTVVDDMLGHLEGTRGALALMQFACATLWEARDTQSLTLTRQAYRAIGGVAGALGSHADALLATFPPRTVPLVRAIFVRLVTAERTGALVTLAELRDVHPDPLELTAVVDELHHGGLLSVHSGARGATVELVSESLLYTWPTLKRWLEECAEDSAIVEQLRVAASTWERSNRSDATLWTGVEADAARRFSTRYRGALSDVQRGFLVAVAAKQRRKLRRHHALRVGAIVFLATVAMSSLVGLFLLRQSRDDALAQATAARVAEGQARQRQEAAEQRDRERASAWEAKAADAETIRQRLERALSESAESAKRGRRTDGPRQALAQPKVGPPRETNEPPSLKPPDQGKEASETRAGEAAGSSVIDTLR